MTRRNNRTVGTYSICTHLVYTPQIRSLLTRPRIDFVSRDNNNLTTTHYFKRVNSLSFFPHPPEQCPGLLCTPHNTAPARTVFIYTRMLNTHCSVRKRCHETPHRPHRRHRSQIQVLGIGKMCLVQCILLISINIT